MSAFQVLIILCGIPTILAIVLGNLLVLISFAIDKKLRSKSNLLLAVLAGVDFLTGTLLMPIGLAYQYNGKWPFGDTQGLCQFHLVCVMLFTFLSSNTLVLIAKDRYKILFEGVHYLQHSQIVIEPFVKLIIFSFWLLYPILLQFDIASPAYPHDKYCTLLFTEKTKYWMSLSTFACVIYPMAMLARFYVPMFKEIRRRLRLKIQHDIGGNTASTTSQDASTYYPSKTIVENVQQGRMSRREIRAGITLGFLIGGYYLSWAPTITLVLINVTGISKIPPNIFVYVAACGYAFNSMVNPIIYALRNPEFQKNFKKILTLGIRL